MNPDSLQLARLHEDLARLRARVAAVADDPRVASVHRDNRASARNLLHYVALQHEDVRELQRSLAELGLSSLGRAEAHVLATIDAVRRTAAELVGDDPPQLDPAAIDHDEGQRLLEDHATGLLGPARSGRRTRIMVTLPTEAASDPAVIERIVAAGAELVRINCAHDDPDAWRAMVKHVREAEELVGRRVRVTMDLAGPKLRTGPITTAPGVVRLRPRRDAYGRVLEPAAVWLTGPDGPADPEATGGTSAATIRVEDPSWLGRRRPGEPVRFRDARGSRRSLVVTAVRADGVRAELHQTAYVVGGTTLVGRDGDSTAPDGAGVSATADPVEVAALPPRDQRLKLHRGDLLVLTDDPAPADPYAVPARVGCTLPEVFRDARVGDRVFFDDGKVGGFVERAERRELHVRLDDAAPRGARLAEAKGINLPDTVLDLPALTEDDVEALVSVAELADAVSLSFVRSGEDVAALQEELARLGRTDLGLILKVETISGFENLPDILLTAMRSPQVGVMIARGDLAVEAGYARLAEVQEEILWLCEAAHVPVVWATQVLDTLARTGRPSRAEVTDAAASGRAECVMLNKGAFVVDAVELLDDILSRMGEHQRKKSHLLRRLRAWDRVGPAAP